MLVPPENLTTEDTEKSFFLQRIKLAANYLIPFPPALSRI